jgi:hypothetical protein
MKEMRKGKIRGDRGQQIGRAFSPWRLASALPLGLPAPASKLAGGPVRPTLVWIAPLALVLAIASFGAMRCMGQTTSATTERVALDRVVAVVNGDLILESDLDEETRMAAFQPLRVQEAATREQLIERLIDRDLILQQIRLQPQAPIAEAQVDAELGVLRKSISGCAAYGCETDAGWEKYVAAQGFTVEELTERWRQRMEVLRFIEARFRMGIRISQAEMDVYYKETLVPAYEKEKVAPPAEASIVDRIQEILLQQQVDKLLDDWLTSLRAEGSVKIVKPGEELP